MLFQVSGSNSAQCPRTDLKKGPYLDQRLPQYESLYPIGLKSERIEIAYIGSHYIDFSKTYFYYIIQKQIYSNYIQTHFS